MIKKIFSVSIVCAAVFQLADFGADAEDLCVGYGPQTPRDIAELSGTNKSVFNLAPPANALNLCNIHLHTNAEHKGPGFSVPGGTGEHGGWKCNKTDSLSMAALTDPVGGHGGFHGVSPGDTIEVHWVYTSCKIEPGPGLGSCLSDSCANPQLRVESQVFLVANDPKALNFTNFSYAGNMENGLHQPRALPGDTGIPVVFTGSTTGPAYSQKDCSPFQVTWSVRPNCATIDLSSLHAWAENGNIFEEDHAHGVRQLVTAPQLLSTIDNK